MNIEKFAEKLKAANDYLKEHEEELGEAVGKAKEIYEAAVALANKKKVNVTDILTGDPETDKATLEAAGVESVGGTGGVTFDDVMKFVYLLADLGGTVIGFAV
jgi:hypothetical protein